MSAFWHVSTFGAASNVNLDAVASLDPFALAIAGLRTSFLGVFGRKESLDSALSSVVLSSGTGGLTMGCVGVVLTDAEGVGVVVERDEALPFVSSLVEASVLSRFG